MKPNPLRWARAVRHGFAGRERLVHGKTIRGEAWPRLLARTNQGCIGSAPASETRVRCQGYGPVHSRYGLLNLSRYLDYGDRIVRRLWGCSRAG